MARTPYIRYVRHRNFNRLRNSKRTLAFLNEQAARLSMTPEQVWNDLMKAQGLTAAQVAALTPEPEPEPGGGLPDADADWANGQGVFRFTAGAADLGGIPVAGINQMTGGLPQIGTPGDGQPADVKVTVMSIDQAGAITFNIMLLDADAEVNTPISTYSARNAQVIDADGTVYFSGTLGSVGSPDNESGAVIAGAVMLEDGVDYALVVAAAA